MSIVFKTPESRDEIRARYNEILSGFPFRQQYAETAYGRTFVLEAGDPGSPALVLLHGSCSNSAFWFGEISVLADMYRVLAVDIIGEAGNSDENRPDLGSDGYADWLKEVLDAFSIEKAVIVGNSLGSWMALKFSVKYPDCVSKLVLIAPSGLSGQNDFFLEKAKKASLQNKTLTMDPSVSGWIELPEAVLEFINLIIRGYNPITETLPVFSGSQLKKLNMPLLFIAGENDAMVDALSAAQRLNELIPGAEIHLLKNTGHLVLNALEYMIPFLKLL